MDELFRSASFDAFAEEVSKLEAFRADKSHVNELVESLMDRAFNLEVEAEKLKKIARHLVAEANEHIPVVPPDSK